MFVLIMEKEKFCDDKTFFMTKNNYQNWKKVEKYYEDSASSLGMFTSGLQNFIAVKQAQQMQSILDIHLRLQLVNKIHDIMLENHCLKMNEIAKKINISNEHVLNILHEHLGMKKLLVRWVLQFLTMDQKMTCVPIFKVQTSSSAIQANFCDVTLQLMKHGYITIHQK